MFGNGGNPFGALAVEDPSTSTAAGPSTRVVEGEEIDVDWLKLIKPNHDVHVRVTDGVDLQDLPSECNLLAVSNIHGVLVAGGNNDIRIHRLSDIHTALESAGKDASPTSAPIQVIPLSAKLVWIRLAMNEERLVIATANGTGVHAFKIHDILSGNTSPYQTFTSNIPSYLLDVLPNPAPSSTDQLARCVALVAKEGLVIADIEGGSLLPPLAGPFTCASWSAKGKQIAVGTPSGKIVAYSPDGVAKAEIPAPPELPSYHPTSLQWLENDLFLVSYARDDSAADDPLEVYLILRQKTSFTYTKFYDPLNSMGYAGRSGAYRHFASLKSWGEKSRHIAFLVSGIASEIGVLHGNAAPDKEPPKWEALMLEETARGGLPAAKANVRDDASAIGLALDLTNNKVLKQGIVGGIEQPDLPPPPRLLAYSQEGVIIAFNVIYPEAGLYPAMVKPQAIGAGQTEDPMDMGTESNTPVESAQPSPAKPAAFGSSAFGASAAASAFGSTAFGQSTPAQPTSGFGTPSKPPAFGSSSFGQSTTPQSTPAAFGSSTVPTAFGQTSFGKPSSPGGFGQSAFGQPSKPTAFGSSTFGTPPTQTKPQASAFGSSSASGSAFGSSSTPSAFGQPAFGQSSKPAAGPTPSAFGQTAFGQSPKPASPAPSAFGSSSPSAFGSPSTSTNVGFGAFGGNKPSETGFGFGKSAFGQTKSEEKKEVASAASPFRSGGSAFGTASAFGTNPFGPKPSTPSTDVKPTFIGFGPKPAIAEKSAFTGFGSSKPASPAADQDSSDFGLGGFASALEPSKPTVVPGLESPPDSPVLGASKAPGLEEDSPPTSPRAPPPPAAAPKPAFSAPSASSSFIKPATAFGSAPSVGSFGQGAKSSTPAFGNGSKPAAFATPPPTASPSASPSAFGAPAFGQASAIGKPAFGTTSFGQSSGSTASAFGQTKPIGNITGGFGAFGAKPTTEGDKKPVGFGGFATSGASAGASIFGSTAAPLTKPSSSAFGNTSAFGNVTTSSTTSIFGPKPTPEPTKQTPLTPPPPEEVKGFDVPAPKPEVDKSTTPTATPVKKEPATTTPVAAPSTKTDTTTPTKTPASEPSTVTTTPEVPAKVQEKAVDPSSAQTGKTEISEIDGAPQTEVQAENSIVYNEEDGGEEKLDHVEDENVGQEEEEEYEEEYNEEETFDEEEEYDEEEEEYEEEEEEDEQEDVRRRSRRSSSVAPDMSPIKEEVSAEELEDEDSAEEEQEDGTGEPSPEVTKTKAKMKSPPPWFALPTKGPVDPGPISPTPLPSSSSAEGPSLLSRLSPPSATNPASSSTSDQATSQAEGALKPPAFSFKHAARTPSPLAAQPPETAESTTPIQSPAKPKSDTGLGLFAPKPVAAPSNTNLFASKPADAPNQPPSAPPSFFGAKSVDTAKSDSPVTTPGTGFNFFGGAKAESTTSSSVTSTPSFFAPKPVQPIAPKSADNGLTQGPPSLFGSKTLPPANDTAKPSFGLGLGRPGSSAPPQISSPFTNTTSTQIISSSATTTAPVKTKDDVAPAPPPPVTFTVPKRPVVPTLTNRPEGGDKSMGAVIERMIGDLQDDIQRLKGTLEANAVHHKAFTVPSMPKITGDNLGKHDIIPFSSVPELSAIVEGLSEELAKLRSKDSTAELKLAELQSRMLKMDMKMGQADKFLKARQDPSFAKVMQVKDLSPQQAANQIKLRKAVQVIEARVEELHASISGLKKRVERRDQGRSQSSQPALERVQRSVRNIDAAIRDRQQTIDDLTRRIGGIKLSPSQTGSPTRTPHKSLHASVKTISFEPSKDVVIEVERALEAGVRGNAKWKRFEGKLARLTKMTEGKKGLLAHASLANGPVMIDALPLPGQIPTVVETPSEPTVKAEPISPDSTPSAPSSTSNSIGFSGIKFSLDPGDISSLASSNSNRQGSSTRSTSHRSHTPAPKFVPTSTSSPDTSNLFSFAPPSKGTNENGDSPASVVSKPSPGFFSFSGFGKK